MSDFRLKVFHTVALRLSFTRAAEELFITQPAVTKHIHELENEYHLKLFERSGSRITLSEAGKKLFSYSKQVFELYRSMEYDMHAFREVHRGRLCLGASTTLAQYVLPPMLAQFHTTFKEIKTSLLTDNTINIESSLDSNEIDLAIIEGKTRNTAFKYTELTKDEIVLVCAANSPYARKGSIKLNALNQLPLVLREPGSGTLEFVLYELKAAGIKLSELNIEIQMNSPESIKSYLLNAPGCMAFLSIHTVSKEIARNELCIIDVKGLSIEREFNIIQPHGGLSALAELFMKFALKHISSIT